LGWRSEYYVVQDTAALRLASEKEFFRAGFRRYIDLTMAGLSRDGIGLTGILFFKPIARKVAFI
jgi:hypothetical protein